MGRSSDGLGSVASLASSRFGLLPLGVGNSGRWLVWEQLLVDTDVKDKLASSAVLDNTSLLDLDRTGCVSLWEDRVSDNRIDKVGSGGFGVGGGNDSLLEAVKLEVGSSELLRDLNLDGVDKVSLRRTVSNESTSPDNNTHLDESLDDGPGEPGADPLVVLPDLEVKVGQGDIDVFDLEEGLSVVVLVGVLEGDVERDSLLAKGDVEQTGVLEGRETSLLGHPEGNVGGGKVNTRDS